MNEIRNGFRLVEETETFSLGDHGDLLLRRNTANEIVAIEFILPMGSRAEPAEFAGITTLALRMLTRGTRTKSDYEVAVGLESLGASFSTEVRKDRAIISVQTTAPRVAKTLEIVEEILTEPAFPEEMFEIEKEILIQEIREDLDSPFTAAFRLFQRTLFENHPYGHHGMGTCETVGSLTHERVRSFFEDHFGRGNTTVGVVGDVSVEELQGPLERIIESYSSNNRGPDSNVPPSIVRAPARAKKVYETRSTEAECIVYGFPVPGFREPEYAAIKVLDSIVGGSMDSRLFSEIREKRGLVYQIGSSYPALEWQGMFAISLVSTRANHDKILENLGKEIDRLKETLAEKDEIARAKTYLRGTFLMSMERNSDQALMLARYHSFGLGIDHINRYLAMIEKVTADSVREVAHLYCTQPTLAIVGPGE